MMAAPVPSDAEARENAAFEALLWALSRPGLARRLPTPGPETIIDALLDRECRAFCADPRLLPNIMRTGAEIAPIDVADHVFLGTLASADALQEIAVGSDLHPDAGATVILNAKAGDGDAVLLKGPGIDGALDLSLSGLPEGFWQMRAARLRYPMGFDILFLDGSDVIGLPRSTEVEVH